MDHEYILQVHRFATLSSTNKTALEFAAKGARHGEVVLAEKQTDGRGRLGKIWSSPAGKGLYFSLILRPALLFEEYPKLTLVAGIGVAEGIDRFCGVTSALKWPNDVYLSGRKCCGILAETSSAGGGQSAAVIIGIGVNVDTALEEFPEDVRKRATSLYLETGSHFKKDELLTALCDSVLQEVALFEEKGFAGILKRWRKRDYLKGKRLAWVTTRGDVVEGVSLGPEEDGSLQIRDDAGNLHRVLSGDVSLAGRR